MTGAPQRVGQSVVGQPKRSLQALSNKESIRGTELQRGQEEWQAHLPDPPALPCTTPYLSESVQVPRDLEAPGKARPQNKLCSPPERPQSIPGHLAPYYSPFPLYGSCGNSLTEKGEDFRPFPVPTMSVSQALAHFTFLTMPPSLSPGPVPTKVLFVSYKTVLLALTFSHELCLLPSVYQHPSTKCQYK